MAQSKIPVQPLSREQLNSLVDKAADIIRTATDYKFILVLLFLKRVSDTWKEEFENKKRELAKYLDEKSAEKEAENEVYHTFNLKRELLWDETTEDVKKLPENLSNALIKIADLNKDLKGVIDKFSFLGFTTQEHKEKLRQLVELFNRYNFGSEYVSSDIVGDAYEHILYRFAPTKAKEGEVYTPREVIQLMVEILDPKPGQSVCDPACGSGGMLIVSHRHVRQKYGREERLSLYGQEYNADISGFCRLNLVAHGIADAGIEFGDSLLYPRFTEGGRLKQFDVVIANPPWNQDGYGEATLKKADFRERYSFGYPPNTTADWAWIQHMLATSNGVVGVILDLNALHRGDSEQEIRKDLVERNLVECIILLPPKLFYNTPSSGVIIILNRNKPPQRSDQILVINAVEEFQKHPNVRRLNILAPTNIDRIVKSYQDFSEMEGFSRVINLDEVRNNRYDLNITLYVSSIVKEEEIDLRRVYEDLRHLKQEKEQLLGKVEEYISSVLK